MRHPEDGIAHFGATDAVRNLSTDSKPDEHEKRSRVIRVKDEFSGELKSAFLREDEKKKSSTFAAEV